MRYICQVASLLVLSSFLYCSQSYAYDGTFFEGVELESGILKMYKLVDSKETSECYDKHGITNEETIENYSQANALPTFNVENIYNYTVDLTYNKHNGNNDCDNLDLNNFKDSYNYTSVYDTRRLSLQAVADSDIDVVNDYGELVQHVTTKIDNSYTFKFSCTGNLGIKGIRVVSSTQFLEPEAELKINGVAPKRTNVFSSNDFEWIIPFVARCGDTRTIKPSVSKGIAYAAIDLVGTEFDCPDISIPWFNGIDGQIDPYSGGNLNIYGEIASTYVPEWTISIAGKELKGRGTHIFRSWDGKDANGKVVKPGTYKAVITAWIPGYPQCTKSKDLQIVVKPFLEEYRHLCRLFVDFGSAANMANGNLAHSQELFSTKGTGLSSVINLYYNSIDSHDGPLGIAWSHSYDIFLAQKEDGAVVLYDGNGKWRLFDFVNGAFVGQAGDYSNLVKKGDGSFKLTQKDGTNYIFGADGKIAAIVDRNGNAITFVYTGGNLVTVTDPAGRVTALSYDAANHLISITDPAGNNYAFTYGGNTLTSVIYPDGETWRYTYDANAFMLTKTDPMGNITTYTYDDQHRVASSTDPVGKVRSISYPSTGSDVTKTTVFTEKDGGVWQYTYDTKRGTLTSKIDPQGGVTSYTYDSAGNSTSTTTPDGATTTATYDGYGNMLTSTDAMGQTTSYSYNSFGQVISVTDPQGDVTSYQYDATGNMTAQTDATGATTTYGYDAKGNVVKITGASGLSTAFNYDSTGNLATVTDATGATISYTYDAAGNMTSQTDADGATMLYEYNARNQLVKMTDPQGNFTTYTYDLSGNKLSQIDANDNTTKYEYNYKGQLTKTTDALGNVTAYTYSGSGCPSCGGGTDKLVSLTDSNGNVTRYGYDQLGRLINETDPQGNVTSYAYDAKGNLVSRTDGNGATITYSYDANGRLLKQSYPDNTGESFTYDARGNILAATNKEISYSFSYDGAGRMLSATDSNGKVVQYAYDGAGRKTKTIYPEGSVVSYAYDSAGRLANITNGGRTYGFSYDVLGRRTKLAYPNGATANYDYDAKGNLTTLTHKSSSGKTIASFTYTHDNVGNRLTKTEPDQTWNYGYDKIYRLLQALPTKHKGHEHYEGDMAEQYSYDPPGNRLTGPRRHDIYTYGAGNQLLTGRRQSFGYDKNGNRTGKAVKPEHDWELEDEGHGGKQWTYYYDYENRLIKAETRHGHEATTIIFKYDPLGRRIEKRVEKAEHGKSEEIEIHDYLYDGQAIILEYETKHDDGKAKTEITKYLHGPNIDEPLAMQRKGEVFFYHADGLGSVAALTDKKQKVIESYEYDSFGNLHQRDKHPMQPFTFTGREWDKETGLYYYRARYYDPMEGRFIAQDPIDFKGGDLNLYGYVQNNPINWTDPYGLKGLLPGLIDKIGDLLPDEQKPPIPKPDGPPVVPDPDYVIGFKKVCVKLNCNKDPNSSCKGPWLVKDIKTDCWCEEWKTVPYERVPSR